MENKKRFVIIVLILFIFLGLTIFTFANPSEKEQGKGNDTEEKIDDKKQDDEQTANDDKQYGEEQENNSEEYNGVNANTNTNVDNNSVDANHVVQTLTSDESYDKALKAVIEAEKLYESNSYDKAKDLVDKVTDEDKKKELQSRLDKVKEGIDVKALVETLKNKTESATNKDQMNSARSFRNDEKVESRVSNLSDKNLRDELNSVLDELSKLLNDTIAPKLNVEDGKYYNSFVNVESTDEQGNGAKITIKDSKGNTVNGITKDGKYTITSEDGAYNSVSVTIIIDTVKPIVKVNGLEKIENIYNKVSIYALDSNEFTGTITNKTTGKTSPLNSTGTDEKENYVASTGIESMNDGEYEVIVTDKAGNITTVKFKYDATAPTAEYTLTPEDWTNESVTVTLTTSEAINIPDGWMKVNDTTFTKVYEDNTNVDGEIVTLIDLAGNEGSVTVKVSNIDKEAKGVTFSDNGGTKKRKEVTVEVTVLEENIDKVEYAITTAQTEQKAKGKKFTEAQINGNKFNITLKDLNNDFYIWVKVTDKAGNVKYTRTKYKFKMDSTAPISDFSRMSVLGGTGKEKSVNVGKTVWVYVRYNEKLASEPKITIAGVEAKVFLNDKNEDKNKGNIYYLYVGEAVLPDTLTDGEKITFKVTDAYDLVGNKAVDVTQVTEGNVLVVDTVAPEIKVKDLKGSFSKTGSVEIKDANEFKSTISYNEKDINKDIQSDLQNSGTYFDSYTVYSGDGLYTITATDEAGNVATKTFILDSTAPKATKVIMANENNSLPYVKSGDRVWFWLTYDEELENLPKIKIGETEVEISEVNARYSEPENNLYQYTVAFTMPENIPDGIIPFTIYNAYDKAGNEADSVSNVTEGTLLIVDNTKPALVVDTINDNGYSSTKDPQVHATDSSPFTTTIKLNGEVKREDVAHLNDDGTYSTWFGIGYLEDGEYEIVSKDAAGNITELIKFILDRKAPYQTYVEIQNWDTKTEGYAKVGDRIVVYVIVNEHLSQEPTITINGQTAKIIQTEDGNKWNADWYKYVGEVVMTEDMTEGEIKFTINGYKDLAGNEGNEITNKDITTDLKKIVFDKTAPKLVVDTIDGMGYSNTKDPQVHATDSSPFTTTIKLNGEVKREDVAHLNEDGTYSTWFGIGYLEDGEYEVISEDVTGNQVIQTFTLDRTAPVITKIGGTTGSKNLREPYDFNVIITEKNLDSVYYVWNSTYKKDESDISKFFNSKSLKVSDSDIVKNDDGTYTIKIHANVEGNHMLYLKVIDKVGNIDYGKKGWYQIKSNSNADQLNQILDTDSNGTKQFLDLIENDVSTTFGTAEDVYSLYISSRTC